MLVAEKSKDLMQRALMTPSGRKFLVAAMDKGPFMDHPKLAALAMMLRNPTVSEDEDMTKPGPNVADKKILKAAQ
jgi:hypothetical protein